MLRTISIGPLLLQTPGLALLAGAWMSLTVIERRAKELSLNVEAISALVFYSLVAGIIGSRLAYAAGFPAVYWENPLSLFALNTTTLTPLEGFVIGSVVALAFGQRKGLALRPTLDALTPGLAAFMVAWGVSHVLSGDAFGTASDVPWAITLWGKARHPVQIYETLLALGIFILVWKYPLKKPGAGINFLYFLSLSALSRLFLEAFRGDSLVWLGRVRAAQVISLLIVLISLWLMRAWVSAETDA
ncbi:MAG: prolipoprotein diacylglyceryl transferase [Anaerolineales bacterium]